MGADAPSPRPEIELGLLTSPEASARLIGGVAIVPVGAVEQHGPHLPLDTDIFLASSVALEAAKRVGGSTVVCPPLCIGASAHHLGFPGTLSLRHDTLFAVVRDTVDSLVAHGCHRVLLLNGHGGNAALIARAVQEIGVASPARLAGLSYWQLAGQSVAASRRSAIGGMAHGGEFETSLMLHLRPSSVRTDLIAACVPAPRLPGERFDLFDGGWLAMDWRTEELSPSGVVGRPDLASAGHGARWFEACVAACAELVVAFAALPTKAAGAGL